MAFYSEHPLEEYAKSGRQAALFEPGGEPLVRFGHIARNRWYFLRYVGLDGPAGFAFVDRASGERIRLRRSHSIFDANTYMPAGAQEDAF